jgi:hypothetical protein
MDFLNDRRQRALNFWRKPDAGGKIRGLHPE